MAIFLLLTSILIIVDLLVGSVPIPFKQVISILMGHGAEKESWQIIVLDARLPKVLTAILCGATLPISGLMMQTLFRNPLAGPYILGISSGAGLGVAIFIMGLSTLGFSLFQFPILSNYGLIIFSVMGSLLVLLILLAFVNRLKDILTVLILGIMIGSIITAVIGIIQFYSHSDRLKSFVLWTLGDLSTVSLSDLSYLTPIVILGLIAVFLLSKQLNTYLLGEEYAQSLGLNVKAFQTNLILITGVLTGVTTAYCGPIGFIGIIIPHLARLLSGSSNHRTLIPFSIILGIFILLIADIVSQLPGSDKILPINTITALIGIPFIIWIILRNKSFNTTA